MMEIGGMLDGSIGRSIANIECSHHSTLKQTEICRSDSSGQIRWWNMQDKDATVAVHEDGLRLCHTGTTVAPGHIRSHFPATFNLKKDWFSYFEVKIMGNPEGVTIGFVPGPSNTSISWLSRNQYPTYGYDFGNVKLFKKARLPSKLSSQTTGIVIGCGLDDVKERVFFTRNGHFLEDFPVPALFSNARKDRPVFPAIRIYRQSGLIYTNYGLSPFKFAITDHPTMNIRRLTTRLAPEIIAIILGHLCDDARSPSITATETSDLINCMRTCRYWYECIRPALRQTKVLNHANYELMLSALAQPESEIDSTVRQLKIYEGGHASSSGSTWGIRILQALGGAGQTALEVLEYKKDPSVWNHYLRQHPVLTMLLRHVYAPFCNLRILRLQNHRFPSAKDLMRLVEALSVLEALHLTCVIWGRQPLHPPAIRSSSQLVKIGFERCKGQHVAVWILASPYPRGAPIVKSGVRPALDELHRDYLSRIVGAFSYLANNVVFQWMYDGNSQVWHFTADMSSTDELGISSRLDISLITEGPLENATVTQLDIVVLELTPHGDQDSDRLYRLYSTYITLFCQFDWRTVDDALSRMQVQRFVVRFSNCLTYVDSDKTLLSDAAVVWEELTTKSMPQIHTNASLRLEVLSHDDPSHQLVFTNEQPSDADLDSSPDSSEAEETCQEYISLLLSLTGTIE